VSGLGLSGLVHLSSIEDDFFIFDEARNQLTGRRTRRVIRLGDRVTVQVSKVDTFKKQVDFKLARTLPEGGKKTHVDAPGRSPGRDRIHPTRRIRQGSRV
jgi:ribonuclease R